MSERIENCKITSTRFGVEDHGILTFWVMLEGDGWGQGLGGYACDGYNQETKSRDEGFGPALIAMRSILETVGATKWEDLPGTLCRAKISQAGSSQSPILGHIIKNQWFDLAAFMHGG